MYNLTKEEKLNFVLKTQIELKVSANTISKNTKLTEAGVQRILNGTSKSPQENSLNQIIEFFKSKMSAENSNNSVNEPEMKYITIPETTELQQQIINMYKEIFEIRNEVGRLQKILEENSVKY